MKKEAKIIDVPVKMRKYFGEGKMLHPDLEMVEEAIQSIPKGKLALAESLCKKLADAYGADVSCPMRTTAAVKKIAESQTSTAYDESVPYWRVIRNNHLLINSQNIDLIAMYLQKEGFELIPTKKGDVKVMGVEDRLFEF